MVKRFILDTNILIDSPLAINGFEDNEVIITATTLEELDHLKGSSSEAAAGAREAIRQINALRELEGDYENGYKLKNGGLFKIELDSISDKVLPQGWSLSTADNRILSTAVTLSQNKQAPPVVLVTNDTSMSIKASAIGIKAQGYKNQEVSEDYLFQGVRELTADESFIQDLYKAGCIPTSSLTGDYEFLENEFVTFKCGQSSVLTRVKEGEFYVINTDSDNVLGIKGRNVAQKYSLHALLDDDIPLVILNGPAGTGKTLLAMAAALDQVYDGKYEKIMIARSAATAQGEDLGFLPGDIEDKVGPLLAPFIDSIECILKSKCKDEDPRQIKMQIEDLFESGTIEVSALAYLRGRSLANTFYILDEAQNITPGQALEVVTRIGQGSKLVLLGDPAQIDRSTLNERTNGLVFAQERMKASSLSAVVTFNASQSVRSPLAMEGARLLKGKF